jgi:hypothetical protein
MTGPVCRACGLELVGRCRAEEYGAIVGRAGRHGGRCWSGYFPSKDEVLAERKRLARARAARLAAGMAAPPPPPPPPPPEAQLTLGEL